MISALVSYTEITKNFWGNAASDLYKKLVEAKYK